jgi:hypothetical protein
MTLNPDQLAAEVCDYEMQHPLERAGFELQALYGGVSRGSLTEESTDMIWAAARRS